MQGTSSIAIGYQAGQNTQQANAIAIGYQAGQNTQSSYAVAIGYLAGSTRQLFSAVAIGNQAGVWTQGQGSIAIGSSAGYTNQGWYSIAVGYQAGSQTQGTNGIAIGYQAGASVQGTSAIAIGYQAGAFGATSGSTQGQDINAIAIGNAAGSTAQGSGAIAIGYLAGRISQSGNSIAIGQSAGNGIQGSEAIAIGYEAGYTNQGANSIAIGKYAGQSSQPANSIVINATGTNLNGATSSAFYAAPIRNPNQSYDNFLNYDVTTKEVVYNYFMMPVGGTGTRPSPAVTGMMRYNTTTGIPEFYNGTNWLSFLASYTSYTPTFTNFTLGNGTATARYAQQGQLTDVYIRIVLGSTSVMGTAPRISLPATANFASIGANIGTALNGMVSYTDTSATNTIYGLAMYYSNTEIELRPFYSSGNYLQSTGAQINATTPFTWATTDEIWFNFSYHSA